MEIEIEYSESTLKIAFLCESTSSLATTLSWTQLSHPAILHLLPDRTFILCFEMPDTNCETSSQPNPLCSDAFEAKEISASASINHKQVVITHHFLINLLETTYVSYQSGPEVRVTLHSRELPRILHQQIKPARDRVFADKRISMIRRKWFPLATSNKFQNF